MSVVQEVWKSLGSEKLSVIFNFFYLPIDILTIRSYFRVIKKITSRCFLIVRPCENVYILKCLTDARLGPTKNDRQPSNRTNSHHLSHLSHFHTVSEYSAIPPV